MGNPGLQQPLPHCPLLKQPAFAAHERRKFQVVLRLFGRGRRRLSGDEHLFPREDGWECRSCLRAFAVTFLGQVERPEGVPSPVSPGAGS